MKKTAIGVVLLGILLGASALGCQSAGESGENDDVLFQYSTLGSLMAGVYDGEMTYAELKQHGDFGLGTFNTLDGEMIEIEHHVYQVRADGVAYPVDDQMKTPFAVVTYFEPDQTVEVTDSVDYSQFKAYLDSVLPTENIPYAIRIAGTFAYVRTRSVPKQAEPYPPLLEVMETQPTFEFREVQGVMLGFRLPTYMATANAPGYHFHFITADRKAGGHVLEFQVEGVAAEIDSTDEWYTVLPGDDAFYRVDISDDEYQR
jgi:acetolactate decarboxylase